MTDPLNGRWHQEDADVVSAAWDALAGGSRAEERGGRLVDAARRLHDLDTAPALSTAQRARIWQNVLDHAVHGNGSPPHPGNGKAGSNGHAPGVVLVPLALAPVAVGPESRPRWVLTQLATAALLLLTIGLTYVAFGRGSPRGDAGTTLPAVVAPEDVGSIGDEPKTLVEVTVPASMVPTGETVTTCLSHITIPPRTQAT